MADYNLDVKSTIENYKANQGNISDEIKEKDIVDIFNNSDSECVLSSSLFDDSNLGENEINLFTSLLDTNKDGFITRDELNEIATIAGEDGKLTINDLTEADNETISMIQQTINNAENIVQFKESEDFNSFANAYLKTCEGTQEEKLEQLKDFITENTIGKTRTVRYLITESEDGVYTLKKQVSTGIDKWTTEEADWEKTRAKIINEEYEKLKDELDKDQCREDVQNILNGILEGTGKSISISGNWYGADEFEYTDENGDTTKKDFLSQILEASGISIKDFNKAAQSYFSQKYYGTDITSQDAEETKDEAEVEDNQPADEAQDAEETKDEAEVEDNQDPQVPSDQNAYEYYRDTGNTENSETDETDASDETGETAINREATNIKAAQVLVGRYQNRYIPASTDDKTVLIENLFKESGGDISVDDLKGSLGYKENDNSVTSIEAEAIANIIDSNSDGKITTAEWEKAKETLSENGVFSASTAGKKAYEYFNNPANAEKSAEPDEAAKTADAAEETDAVEEADVQDETDDEKIEGKITVDSSKIQDKLKTDDNGNSYIEVESWNNDSESLNCLSRIISNAYGVKYGSDEGQQILQKLIEANPETIDPNNLDMINAGAKIVLPDVETKESENNKDVSKTEDTDEVDETDETDETKGEDTDSEEEVTSENADAIISETQALEMGQNTEYNRNYNEKEKLHEWYRQVQALDITYDEEVETDKYRVRKENGKKIVELGCKDENGEFIAAIRYESGSHKMETRWNKDSEFTEPTSYKKKPESK